MDLSVVICTHNRSQLVRAALERLFSQQTGPLTTEIIVVDNNSTDDTAEVVQELVRAAPVEAHYLFEAAQGISYARNTGWRFARGANVAFTDDDVRAEPGWMAQIVRAFDEHPDIESVGGKVLPEWPTPPPRWLTRDHWAPLAILDYGDSPLHLDHDDPRCLIGANFAVRRSALERLGGFSPAVQRVKDGIGSIEDHEFLSRLWNAGDRALYVPELVVFAPVDAPRLNKTYHRRWHSGHGHFHAIMRSPAAERSSAGRFFDVPAYMYRQFVTDSVSWANQMVRGRADEAFVYENRVRFCWGFARTRVRQYLSGPGGRRAETELPPPAPVPHHRSSGVP